MTEFFLRRRWLAYAAIAAVSVAFHLRAIASPMLDNHYHRQCNTAAIARNYHENGLRFLFPQIDWEGAYDGRTATEFPLYMWLVGLLWPVLGLGDLWGRILSTGFSALTAVYLFKLLERKLPAQAAFYASLFFSCLPLEIYFGRTVQPEALALLGTVAAFYHWDKFSADGSWKDWSLAVLCAFLAIGHKLPYAYMLAPLAALSGLSPRNPRIFLAPILALSGVYAWYHYASASQTYVVPSRASEFLLVLNYERLPRYLSFQLFSRFPELACTYGGLALMVIGARALARLKRERWPEVRFLGVWFLSVAAGIALGGGYSFHHEYTSLPFVPINAALMGLGLWTLLERLSPGLPAPGVSGAGGAPGERPPPPATGSGSWARAALALLVLSIPIHALARTNHWYRISYPFLKDARKAADAVSRPDDLFVCNERGGSVFLYYLHRKGWSWDLEEQGESSLGMLQKRIDQGAAFFVTHKTPAFERKQGVYANFLYGRYPVVYDADGILIFGLRPRSPGLASRPEDPTP